MPLILYDSSSSRRTGELSALGPCESVCARTDDAARPCVRIVSGHVKMMCCLNWSGLACGHQNEWSRLMGNFSSTTLTFNLLQQYMHIHEACTSARSIAHRASCGLSHQPVDQQESIFDPFKSSFPFPWLPDCKQASEHLIT